MAKKYKVYLTEHAQKDLEHIFYDIADDSPPNASNFIIELEKNIYSLATFPLRNPAIPENRYLDTDYRHLIHKKYRVIYRVSKDAVFILRVIHGEKLLTF